MKTKRLYEATNVDSVNDTDEIILLNSSLSKSTAYNLRRFMNIMFTANTGEAGTTTYYFKIGDNLNTAVRLRITSVDHNSVRIEAQTLDVIISSQGVNLMKHHIVSKSRVASDTISVKYGVTSGKQYLAITAINAYNKTYITFNNLQVNNKIEQVTSFDTTGFANIAL
ncbi:MAG: hypothetical protein PHG18_05380 [Bacilli bacterium]|nr:hypothetical protein [Bacilli bacterium]